MIPETDEALGRLVDAAADFLDLRLPEASRPGLIDNLRTLRRHANLVMEFPICERTDIAPIFRL